MYYSPNIIRMIDSRELRKAELVVRMREKRNICRFLIGKRKGKRPLRRSRGRWEDIKLSRVQCNSIGVCGLDSSGCGLGPANKLS